VPEVRQSFASRLRQVVESRPILPLYRLRGETPETRRALHALNAAGLLGPNVYAKGQRILSCPRCGRQTAVWGWGLPSVCTGCRVERLAQADTSFLRPGVLHPGEWNRLVYARRNGQ
jgi:hypothetical protein